LLEKLKRVIPGHCTVHKEEIMKMYLEKTTWRGAGEIIAI
jgi:metal-dependent hydrolase (beta-lactamase superfamily II)